MYASSTSDRRPSSDYSDVPSAVEVHGLDASASLLQLRQLFKQVGAPMLQAVAALDAESQQGVALVIFSSGRGAAAAVELFDGYPLGNSFLHVKRAEGLPNSLINLLYSVDQASGAIRAGRSGRRWLPAGGARRVPPDRRAAP